MNISIFDVMYPDYKIDKPIRLIELFAGVGSQAMALRNIGANFEHYKIAEWEVSAFKSYKAIHMPNDDTDYSQGISKGELTQILFDYGISTNGKDPMTIKEIQRKNEKWLRETYNNIKATNNLGSICNFKGEDLKIVDTDSFTYLLTYSFPCQDLSVAGKMKGMSKGDKTRSGLLWEVERLLNEVKELPQVLLMENVPQVISDANIKDFQLWQRFLEDKGYSNYTEILNAKNYGVAQNRERCFMVSLLGEWNYKFPKPIPLTKTMKDYLEDEVDEKYYINNEKAQKLIQQLVDGGQLGGCIGNVNPSGNGINGNVFGQDGLSPTLTTNKGEGPKICTDLSINNPKVTDISNCITARQDRGISNHQGVGGAVVEVKVIGQMDNTIDRTFESANRIYDKNGLSPTINTCGGGGLQPKVIVASRGRNPDNPSDRKQGIELEQRLEPNSEGICNTLTSVQKDNLVLEPAILTPKRTEYGKAIRKDYENGKIQESRHNMTELQPRSDGISNTLTTVQKDNLVLEPKLVGGLGEKDWGKQWRQGNRVYDADAIAMALNASPVGNAGGYSYLYKTDYRIRKLTPLECWRLMGFTDEDFYKAKFVFENEQSLEKLTREKFYNILYSNLSETKKLYHIERLKIKTKERTSNTQLYKQAGNSIVVKVLEGIFKQML